MEHGMEENMMNNTNFLPLGSVVQLKESNIRLMIVARAVMAPIKGEMYYLDYAACVFPFGVEGNEVIYFSNEDIETVHFKGLVDDDEIMMQSIISNSVKECPYPKVNMKELM